MTKQPSSLSFSDFQYERPNLDQLGNDFTEVLAEFQAAATVEAAALAVEQLDAIRSSIMTAYNICHIRYTINTQDPFYAEEHKWFDENSPRTEAWRSDYYKALIDSPHRKALEKRFGAQFFRIAELTINTFITID